MIWGQNSNSWLLELKEHREYQIHFKPLHTRKCLLPLPKSCCRWSNLGAMKKVIQLWRPFSTWKQEFVERCSDNPLTLEGSIPGRMESTVSSILALPGGWGVEWGVGGMGTRCLTEPPMENHAQQCLLSWVVNLFEHLMETQTLSNLRTPPHYDPHKSLPQSSWILDQLSNWWKSRKVGITCFSFKNTVKKT